MTHEERYDFYHQFRIKQADGWFEIRAVEDAIHIQSLEEYELFIEELSFIAQRSFHDLSD
jgi:hypothetical protein